MEGAIEADDAEKRSGCPRLGIRPADHLHHALVRLGARVAEEHAVGEGGRDQAFGQPLSFRTR